MDHAYRPVSVLNGSAKFPDFDELDEAPQSFTTTGGWLGFGDNYWLTAIIPDQSRPVEASFRAGPNRNYQADFAAPAAIVAPGQAQTYHSASSPAKEVD